MRDQLASANHKTAATMAEHADCIWDARTAKDSVSAVADSVDAVSGRSSPQNRRRSPDRRQPVVSRPQRTGTPNPGRRDGDGRRKDGSPSPYCYPCTWAPGN